MTKYREEIRSGKRKTKPCPGPLHKGKELPLNRFARRQKDDPTYLRSWCKECELSVKTKRGNTVRHGQVPVEKVRFVFIELRERLGMNEMSRQTGISKQALHAIFYRNRKFVHKHTLEKAIVVLYECRRKNIVRHKHAISYGHSLRGKPEPKVTNTYLHIKRRQMKMSAGERELEKFLEELT